MTGAGDAKTYQLASLTPLQQLKAGRLPRRLVQVTIGLWLFGTAIGMFVRSNLSLPPWDVFHYGVVRHLGWSFGTVLIVTGFVVLLLWIPLRQWPGVGTILNAVVIGVATDATLVVLPAPTGLGWRWVLLVAAMVLNGLASAMYIGCQLGTGPRDGLMTGLSQRTGWSLRLVRTGLEIVVLGIGWLLGGVVGVGTVMFALLIGPLTQFFLPWLTVSVTVPPAASSEIGAEPT